MNKYGIIGFPLGHSFSKNYFEEKFKTGNIDNALFVNYELSNIQEVSALIADPQLKGFCITIPYKKAILPYLSESSEAVKRMAACNCVRIKDGMLFGHNTDVLGFEKSFVPHLKSHHQKALILGTGGAAAAVTYVLQKLHIGYQHVSRTKREGCYTYQDLTPEVMKAHHIIINCTPLGTYPKVEGAPAIPYQYLDTTHYLFDLVYNPPLTRFLAMGVEQGAVIQNGYPMLTIQAEENWRIWNA